MTLKYFIIKNGKIYTKFKNNRLSVCLMENDDITKKNYTIMTCTFIIDGLTIEDTPTYTRY